MTTPKPAPCARSRSSRLSPDRPSNGRAHPAPARQTTPRAPHAPTVLTARRARSDHRPVGGARCRNLRRRNEAPVVPTATPLSWVTSLRGSSSSSVSWVINSAFAGVEPALVSLREGQLQRRETNSAIGALLAQGASAEPVLGHDPDRDHPRRVPRVGHGRGLARSTIGGTVVVRRRPLCCALTRGCAEQGSRSALPVDAV